MLPDLTRNKMNFAILQIIFMNFQKPTRVNRSIFCRNYAISFNWGEHHGAYFNFYIMKTITIQSLFKIQIRIFHGSPETSCIPAGLINSSLVSFSCSSSSFQSCVSISDSRICNADRFPSTLSASQS